MENLHKPTNYEFEPPKEINLKEGGKAQINFEKGTLTVLSKDGETKTYNIKFGGTLVRDLFDKMRHENIVQIVHTALQKIGKELDPSHLASLKISSSKNQEGDATPKVEYKSGHQVKQLEDHETLTKIKNLFSRVFYENDNPSALKNVQQQQPPLQQKESQQKNPSSEKTIQKEESQHQIVFKELPPSQKTTNTSDLEPTNDPQIIIKEKVEKVASHFDITFELEPEPLENSSTKESDPQINHQNEKKEIKEESPPRKWKNITKTEGTQLNKITMGIRNKLKPPKGGDIILKSANPPPLQKFDIPLKEEIVPQNPSMKEEIIEERVQTKPQEETLEELKETSKKMFESHLEKTRMKKTEEFKTQTENCNKFEELISNKESKKIIIKDNKLELGDSVDLKKISKGSAKEAIEIIKWASGSILKLSEASLSDGGSTEEARKKVSGLKGLFESLKSSNTGENSWIKEVILQNKNSKELTRTLNDAIETCEDMLYLLPETNESNAKKTIKEKEPTTTILQPKIPEKTIIEETNQATYNPENVTKEAQTEANNFIKSTDKLFKSLNSFFSNKEKTAEQILVSISNFSNDLFKKAEKNIRELSDSKKFLLETAKNKLKEFKKNSTCIEISNNLKNQGLTNLIKNLEKKFKTYENNLDEFGKKENIRITKKLETEKKESIFLNKLNEMNKGIERMINSYKNNKISEEKMLNLLSLFHNKLSDTIKYEKSLTPLLKQKIKEFIHKTENKLKEVAFIDSSIKNLLENQKLTVTEGGRICWAEKKDNNGQPIWTGQNIDNLKKQLKAQYIIAKEYNADIKIRLKSGTTNEATGFKHAAKGGETFTVDINLKGEVKNVSKKVKTLGVGTFAKVQKVDIQGTNDIQPTSSAFKIANGREKLKSLQKETEEIIKQMGGGDVKLDPSIQGIKAGFEQLEKLINSEKNDFKSEELKLQNLIQNYYAETPERQNALNLLKPTVEGFKQALNFINSAPLKKNVVTNNLKNELNELPTFVKAISLPIKSINIFEGVIKAEKEILNEQAKLRMLNPNGNIRGLQLPTSHTFVYLQGVDQEGKDLGAKVGHSGQLYDGDASPVSIKINKEGEVKTTPNPWKEEGKWTPKDLLNAAEGLAFGLAYCHKMEVYHGDIKLGNFFRKDKELHLADFGGTHSKNELPGLKNPNGKGYKIHSLTVEVSALEDLKKLYVVDNEKDYTELREKMDVFSLGCSLFELFTDQSIKGKQSITIPSIVATLPYQKIESALTEKFQNDLSVDKIKQLADLIHSMVNTNSTERPTSAEVQQRMAKILG